MGSVAAYPEASSSPIKEEMIWNGLPHESESGYSHAKRTMLAQLLTYQKHYDFSYAYILATNLFGPHDNFDEHLGHVIPSLIKKFYKAKETNSTVTIWGNGTAIRDFLYSNEMARALVLIMEKGQGPINVGSGRLISITYLVDLLAKHFDMPRSRIIWDPQKPNGRSFAELDLSRLKALDFRPILSFEEQLKETVHWFLSNANNLRE
jgi:GDP-L-fucose synthase